MRGCGVIPPPTVAIMEESFIFTYFFLRVLMSSNLLTFTFHWTARDHEVSLVQVFWNSMVCLFGVICEGRSVWHHRIMHFYWWSIKLHQPLPHHFWCLRRWRTFSFFLNFASITAIAKLQWSNVRHVFFIQQVIRHCFFCFDNSCTLDFHLVPELRNETSHSILKDAAVLSNLLESLDVKISRLLHLDSNLQPAANQASILLLPFIPSLWLGRESRAATCLKNMVNRI